MKFKESWIFHSSQPYWLHSFSANLPDLSVVLVIDFLKWTISFIGHLGIWCVMFNHVHATAFPRRARKITEKIVIVAVALPALYVLLVMLGKKTVSFDTVSSANPLVWFYGYGCLLLGMFFVLRWVFRKFTIRLPQAVLEKTTERVNVANLLDTPIMNGKLPELLGRVPGNQALKLFIERMHFELDACPANLDGLTICHLSDLHFTGQLNREYFEEVVRQANKCEPDLVFLTGDICDEMECLDWIVPVLGQLKAKHGKFYVLGNHDKRISDEELLRSTVHQSGFQKVSGEWHELRINGSLIAITGNALPWYRDAEQLKPRVVTSDERAFKILLSHSPDQLGWARKVGFDLMFAGHTHGGQVAFPVIGPIVAPSKHGVKYASGTFMIDEMLVHVSRGISGDEAIRINAAPELGHFTLKSKRDTNIDVASRKSENAA